MEIVSIVIPCYNKVLYVGRTIQSLIDQTYPFWEGIIIDDGSTDDSRKIIQEFVMKDSRIKAIFKPNTGVADTRNKGLEVATGKYVIFLDADDLISSDKLFLTVQKFHEVHDAKVVYSDYHFANANAPDQILYKHNFRIKLRRNVYLDLLAHWDEDLIVPIHCCCYDREWLDNNKIIFDPSLKNKEDWDFILQAAKKTNQFYYLDKDLAAYLVVPQSRSAISNSSMIQGSDQLYCKHYDRSSFDICAAIAYNLRYRIMRNQLIKLLRKREPDVDLSCYQIASEKYIKFLSMMMIPKAILRSFYKLIKKYR